MTSSKRPTAHLTGVLFSRQILIGRRISFYRKTATTDFTIKGKKSRKYQSSKKILMRCIDIYMNKLYISKYRQFWGFFLGCYFFPTQSLNKTPDSWFVLVLWLLILCTSAPNFRLQLFKSHLLSCYYQAKEVRLCCYLLHLCRLNSETLSTERARDFCWILFKDWCNLCDHTMPLDKQKHPSCLKGPMETPV